MTISTAEALGHIRGDDDARHGCGFTTAKAAQRAAERLAELAELEKHAEVLRVYHAASGEGRDGEHKALAALWVWWCGVEGEACLTAKDLAQAFVQGREKEIRERACALYANALLRLDAELVGGAGIDFGIE